MLKDCVPKLIFSGSAHCPQPVLRRMQALRRLETLVVAGLPQAAHPKEHLALLNTLIDLTQDLQVSMQLCLVASQFCGKDVFVA